MFKPGQLLTNGKNYFVVQEILSYEYILYSIYLDSLITVSIYIVNNMLKTLNTILNDVSGEI